MMSIYQLTLNPQTGEVEAGGYTLHAQDIVCVMIPDRERITRCYQKLCDHFYDQYRFFGECSTALWRRLRYAHDDLWQDLWTHTQILYDHGSSRWYLENYPHLQVNGLFIML